MNETALALKNLGDSQTAIKYYEQALTIDRRIFGSEHLDVARDLNNLGTTWRALRRPGGLFSRKPPPWTPRKSF